MAVSNGRRRLTLTAVLGLTSLGFVATIGAAPSDETEPTSIVDVLADLVVSDTMPGRMASEFYVVSQSEAKARLVAEGRISPEDYDKRLRSELDRTILRRRIDHSVACGELSRAAADGTLANMVLLVARRAELDSVQRWLDAAVARGDLTRDEADAKLEAEQREMADRRNGPVQPMAERVAATFAEAGIPHDIIDDVTEAQRRIVVDMREEGDRFELNEDRLAGLPLTADQIEVVVGLARRIAAREAATEPLRRAKVEHDEDEARWAAFRRRTLDAVDRGEITREESKAKFRAFREARRAERAERANRIDWEIMAQHLEAAVERGEVARFHADEMHEAIEPWLKRNN